MQRIEPRQFTSSSNTINLASFTQTLGAGNTKVAKELLVANPSFIKEKFNQSSFLTFLLKCANESDDEETFYELIQFVIKEDPSQISKEQNPDALFEVVVNLFHNKKRDFFGKVFFEILSAQPHYTASSLQHTIHILSSKQELFQYLEKFITLQPKALLEKSILEELPSIVKGACDDAFFLLLSSSKFNINQPTNHGWTALHIAARIGTPQRANWIIENGGDSNSTTPDQADYQTIRAYEALDTKLSRHDFNLPDEEHAKLIEEVKTTPGYLSQPHISHTIPCNSVLKFIKEGIKFNKPQLPFFFLIACELSPKYHEEFLTELLQCASAYGGECISTDNLDLENKWRLIGIKLLQLGALHQKIVFTEPELPEPQLGGIPVLVQKRIKYCETFINSILKTELKPTATT